MKTPALALAASALLAGLAPAQRVDQASAGTETPSVRVVAAPQGGSDAGTLYTNGTYVTQLGVGAGGADVSEVESPSILYGYNVNQTIQARLADDFTVPAGETWDATGMVWLGYQTGAPTTGTLTAITVQVLDGAPSMGGGVIAGDYTTNRLVGATWSGVYRVVSSQLTNANRAIIEVETDTSFLGPVASGTYWLDVGLAGSMSSGPWSSPTVPAKATDNGEQKFGSGWMPLLDPDLNMGHDFWFELEGTATGGGGPGTPYCFGVGCPCGNDDPDAGCANSTGAGALLSGSGTPSIAADDLVLSATGMRPHRVAMLVLGSDTAMIPFQNGLLCVGGEVIAERRRYPTGHLGAVSLSGVVGILAHAPVKLQVLPGETWNFQMWYRDNPAPKAPCGKQTNLTNAYGVTFAP